MMDKPVFKTIEQRWEELAVIILPKDASRKQRIEMKKLFYAGFVSGLSAICYETVNFDDDTAVEKIQDLWQEAENFIGNINWLFSLYNEDTDTSIN